MSDPKTFRFRDFNDPLKLMEDMRTARRLLSSLTYRCPTTANVNVAKICDHATRPATGVDAIGAGDWNLIQRFAFDNISGWIPSSLASIDVDVTDGDAASHTQLNPYSVMYGI